MTQVAAVDLQALVVLQAVVTHLVAAHAGRGVPAIAWGVGSANAQMEPAVRPTAVRHVESSFIKFIRSPPCELWVPENWRQADSGRWADLGKDRFFPGVYSSCAVDRAEGVWAVYGVAGEICRFILGQPASFGCVLGGPPLECVASSTGRFGPSWPRRGAAIVFK